MKLKLRSIAVFLVIFTILSCNDSSFVGSDLFTPESIDLFYKDDFEIFAKTIRVDSTISTDGVEYSEYFINGMLNDPVFGKTVAETYIDLHIGSTYPNLKYYDDNGDTRYVTIDSVIMVLGLYPDGFYGDSLTRHTITVNQLVEKLPEGDTIYTSFQPEYIDFRNIGTATVIPNYIDSVAVLEPGDTVLTKYDAQLRFPLNPAVFEPLVQDTSLVISDVNFGEYIPGIRISSVPENGNSTWGLDLTRTSTQPYNNIVIYYTKGESRGKFHIFIDSHRHNYQVQDYSGSVVSNVFDDESVGNETIYLQGMSGPNIEIDIPGLKDEALKEYLYNKAELEFWVNVPNDGEDPDPLDAINIYRYGEDGELVSIADLTAARDILGSLDIAFKGNLEEVEMEDGSVMRKYRALISLHALAIQNGQIDDTRLVIMARDKINTPKRSVIYGPGDNTYPMKLKLTYSK